MTFIDSIAMHAHFACMNVYTSLTCIYTIVTTKYASSLMFLWMSILETKGMKNNNYGKINDMIIK